MKVDKGSAALRAHQTADVLRVVEETLFDQVSRGGLAPRDVTLLNGAAAIVQRAQGDIRELAALLDKVKP